MNTAADRPGDNDVAWMVALRPAEPTDDVLAMAASTPEHFTRAVIELGPDITAWAVQTAARVVGVVHAGPFELPTMTTGLERQGCEECLLSTLMAMKADSDASTLTAPPGAVQSARVAARQGIGIGVVLQTVWASHAEVQNELLEVLSAVVSSDRIVERLRFLSARLSTSLSVYVRDLREAYEGEQRLWNGRIPALRRSILEAIAAGGEPPPDAESALGIRLDGTHVLALAWVNPLALVPDRDAEMHRLLSSVARVTDAAGSMLIAAGDVTVLWWRFGASIDRSIESMIAGVARSSWVRLAIGPPGRGIAGIRAGIRSAYDLRVLALLERDHLDGWTAMSRGLDALLVRDLDAAQRFAAIEIDPLLGDDPRLRELRETLRLYLRTGRSRAAVAEALTIAPNTVAARVHRALELLGRRSDDRSLELLIALEIAALNLAP